MVAGILGSQEIKPLSYCFDIMLEKLYIRDQKCSFKTVIELLKHCIFMLSAESGAKLIILCLFEKKNSLFYASLKNSKHFQKKSTFICNRNGWEDWFVLLNLNLILCNRHTEFDGFKLLTGITTTDEGNV